MTYRVRVKVYRRGLKGLMRSEEMQSILEERAIVIANAAGIDDHRIEVEDGRRRARAAVITDSIEAMKAESKNRNLTRAIDAAR